MEPVRTCVGRVSAISMMKEEIEGEHVAFTSTKRGRPFKTSGPLGLKAAPSARSPAPHCPLSPSRPAKTPSSRRVACRARQSFVMAPSDQESVALSTLRDRRTCVKIGGMVRDKGTTPRTADRTKAASSTPTELRLTPTLDSLAPCTAKAPPPSGGQSRWCVNSATLSTRCGSFPTAATQPEHGKAAQPTSLRSLSCSSREKVGRGVPRPSCSHHVLRFNTNHPSSIDRGLTTPS